MALHPKGSIIDFNLTGTGEGVLQQVSIDGSSHSFASEGHPAFGGTDSAPSPLDYLLAAFISCNQVTAKIVALGQGIETGRFEGHIHGTLDNSVLVFGADGVSNFDTVTLNFSLETDLDDEAFAAYTDEVARRCPVTQIFERSGVKVTANWTNKTLVAV